MTAVLALLLALGVVQTKTASDIQVTNTAEYVGSGRYNWKVFLTGSAASLNGIDFVEYTLHPSFPDPVRKVADRASNFALSSNGWGEFNIKVKVVYKNRSVRYLDYGLRLDRSAAAQAPPPQVQALHKHAAITTGNTSQDRGDGTWGWTIYVESDERTLQDIQCVEYTLHPTFPDPIQNVCTKGSSTGRGFSFSAVGWGTFVVSVKVSLKDGDAAYLKHQLVFSTK